MFKIVESIIDFRQQLARVTSDIIEYSGEVVKVEILCDKMNLELKKEIAKINGIYALKKSKLRTKHNLLSNKNKLVSCRRTRDNLETANYKYCKDKGLI